MPSIHIGRNFSIRLAQFVSMLLGWTLLTIFNLVPEVMGMPIVNAVRNFDPNASAIERSFEAGYFREYISRDGNLQAGGRLMHNDDRIWYTTDQSLYELDWKKNAFEEISETAMEYPPHFCGNRTYISITHEGVVGVGYVGNPEVSLQEYVWNLNEVDNAEWRSDLYALLARSEQEELTTREMSTLVGYIRTCELVGWDGETAWFYVFDEDAKAAYMGETPETGLLLIPYTANGKGENIKIPSNKPSSLMMIGRTVVYIEEGVLHAYNMDTGENRILSAEGQSAKYLNFTVVNDHHKIVWLSQDGFHAYDIEADGYDYAEGDWVGEHDGLYCFNEHVYALHKYGGYYKWTFKTN